MMNSKTLFACFMLLLLLGCERVSDTKDKAAANSPATVPQLTPPQKKVDACDISTKEKAYAAFSQHEKASVSEDCILLIPELEVALGGRVQLEVGCDYTQVLFRCQYYRAIEASSVVLPALGWKAASETERQRLALLWIRKIVFVNHVEAKPQEPYPDKVGTMDVFPPPKAESLPDGSVRVDTWTLYGVNLGDRRVVRRVFTFGPDATMTDKEVDSYRLGERGPQSWEQIPPVRFALRSTGNSRNDDLRSFLKANQPKIFDKCYQDALLRTPSLLGKMKFQMSCGKQNRVTVKAEGCDAALESAGLVKCVVERMAKLNCPPAPAEASVMVQVTFSSMYEPPPLPAL